MLNYEDNKILVFFDSLPKTTILTPFSCMSKKEREEIKKKPFKNLSDLSVLITDKIKNIKYALNIEKGYRWDGASIPRLFWRIIGSKSDPEYLIPSMVHDKLCENKELINYDRLLSSRVFRGLLIKCGVNKAKADIMYCTVDSYQKFCRWNK